MATQIQFRRDIAVNWTDTNPVLAEGELGYETDTKKFKIGDGTTAWNQLPYYNTGGGEVVASASSVDNIQELLSATQQGVITVLGYHKKDDDGGGIFYWDANKPKSEHNGGTVVDPNKIFPTDWTNQTQLSNWFIATDTTNTGCWVRLDKEVLNVKYFGAKGDGVTTDTKPIQKAIDTAYAKNGATVLLPVGTYLIDSPLKMKRLVSLVGESGAHGGGSSESPSMLGTEIKAKTTMPYIIYTDSSVYNNNLVIKRLTLNGNHNASVGLQLNKIFYNLIQDICIIFTKDWALKWVNGAINTFSRISATSTTNGFYIHGGALPDASTNSYFEDCILYGDNAQIDVGDCADNNIFIRCRANKYICGTAGGNDAHRNSFQNCHVGAGGIVINEKSYWCDTHSDYAFTVTGDDTAINQSTFISMRYGGYQWSKFGNKDSKPIQFNEDGNLILSNDRYIYNAKDDNSNVYQTIGVNTYNNLLIGHRFPYGIYLGYNASLDNPIHIHVNGEDKNVIKGLTGALLAGGVDSSSYNFNGEKSWIQLDNGLIINFETVSVSANTEYIWTYPKPFPNHYISTFVMYVGQLYHATTYNIYNDKTTVRGQVDGYIRCIAVGY